MWPFSSSDDRGQGESEGGFLSGLWTAVKWVAIAAAAVLTLGAVFAFSDKAKNFVDSFTGGDGKGDGKGLGSWLAGIFKGAKDRVTDAVTPTATPDNAAEVGKNDKGQPVSFKASAKTIRALQLPDIDQTGRDQLRDVAATRKEAYKFSTHVGREAALENLDNGQKAVFRAAESIVAYNLRAVEYNQTKVSDAPSATPIIFDTKGIEIPPELNDFGSRTSGKEEWSQKNLIQRLQALHKQLKDKGSLIETPEAANRSHASGLLEELATSSFATSVNSVLPQFMLTDNQKDSVAKKEIRALIDDGKYIDAMKKAKETAEYLEKRGRAYTSSDPAEQLREKDRYVKATEDYKKIGEHIEALQLQSQFDGVLSKFNSRIMSASTAALTNFEQNPNGRTPSSAPAAPTQGNAAGAGSAQAAAASTSQATGSSNVGLSTDTTALAAALNKGLIPSSPTTFQEGLVDTTVVQIPDSPASDASRTRMGAKQFGARL